MERKRVEFMVAIVGEKSIEKDWAQDVTVCAMYLLLSSPEVVVVVLVSDAKIIQLLSSL